MDAREREQHADRQRKAALADRWRTVGACTKCGLPTARFRRCLTCRRKHAKWALAWYHANKKAA